MSALAQRWAAFCRTREAKWKPRSLLGGALVGAAAVVIGALARTQLPGLWAETVAVACFVAGAVGVALFVRQPTGTREPMLLVVALLFCVAPFVGLLWTPWAVWSEDQLMQTIGLAPMYTILIPIIAPFGGRVAMIAAMIIALAVVISQVF